MVHTKNGNLRNTDGRDDILAEYGFTTGTPTKEKRSASIADLIFKSNG